MKCLSCTQDVAASSMKLCVGLLLCPTCVPLAEKSEAEILRELERAKIASISWLQAHILKQGLFRGGDGFVKEPEEPLESTFLTAMRANKSSETSS